MPTMNGTIGKYAIYHYLELADRTQCCYCAIVRQGKRPPVLPLS
jgi:hypothetical protein